MCAFAVSLSRKSCFGYPDFGRVGGGGGVGSVRMGASVGQPGRAGLDPWFPASCSFSVAFLFLVFFLGPFIDASFSRGLRHSIIGRRRPNSSLNNGPLFPPVPIRRRWEACGAVSFSPTHEQNWWSSRPPSPFLEGVRWRDSAASGAGRKRGRAQTGAARPGMVVGSNICERRLPLAGMA